MKVELIVHWELDTLERFILEGHKCFSGHLGNSQEDDWLTPDGRLGETLIYAGCQHLVLELAVQQLNNIVDWILLALSNQAANVRNPDDIAQREKRSRADLINDIHSVTGRPLRFLPGWSEVEQVRKQANALKHRGGVTTHYSQEWGLNLSESVKLSVEQVKAYCTAVRKWLVAAVKTVKECNGAI